MFLNMSQLYLNLKYYFKFSINWEKIMPIRRVLKQEFVVRKVLIQKIQVSVKEKVAN